MLSDPSPFLPYSCEEFYFICIWKKFIRWGGRCPAAQTRPRPSPTRIINVLNEIQGKFKSVEGEKKGGGERLRFVHSATYVSTSRPPRSFNSRENDPSPLYPSRVRRCETEPKPNSYKICHRAIVLSLSLSLSPPPFPSFVGFFFSRGLRRVYVYWEGGIHLTRSSNFLYARSKEARTKGRYIVWRL